MIWYDIIWLCNIHYYDASTDGAIEGAAEDTPAGLGTNLYEEFTRLAETRLVNLP